MRGQQISEIDLIRSIVKQSFKEFIREFWHIAVPNEELLWNWHMDYICKVLQREAERVFRGEPKKHDIIINVPPGSTKSTICSIMFPAWVWAVFPQGRLICASYTNKLALTLSLKSRDVIVSDLYRECFPGVIMRQDQDTKELFMNRQNGMRFSVGSGGSVTGHHGHFIMVDDPIDPLKAFSETELDTVNRWMAETLSTRKVDKDIALTVLIMQRLHENDPTGYILNQVATGKRDILHICLPAEESEFVKPSGLHQKYVDGLLDPRRGSRTILNQAEAELGDYGYAGQFAQHPVPRGGGMIHADKIRIEPQPPANTIKRIVRYWDKAGSAGKGAYTVGVKMAIDRDKRFWILDVVRGQWEAAKRERIIRQIAEVDGPSVKIGIEQEPASGGKESAENTVANLAGFSVFLDRPTGDKALRADPFSVQVNGSNVSMCPGTWNLEYLNELRFFPKSRYKDQVDATSGAFIRLALHNRFIGGLPT